MYVPSAITAVAKAFCSAYIVTTATSTSTKTIVVGVTASSTRTATTVDVFKTSTLYVAPLHAKEHFTKA